MVDRIPYPNQTRCTFPNDKAPQNFGLERKNQFAPN